MTGTLMFDGLPPQIAQAFIGLIVLLLGGFGVTATAVGLWFRSTLRSSANKQAMEISTFKTSYEFVLEQAKRLTDRADHQDETIAQLREGKASDSTKIQMLDAQLQEARLHSRERDERLGEFKAKLEQAIIDRDALAKRVVDLEAIKEQRHEENTQRDIALKVIDVARLSAEKERDSAREALRVANEYVVKLETEIATLKAEATKSQVALTLPPPATPAPVPPAAPVPSEGL